VFGTKTHTRKERKKKTGTKTGISREESKTEENHRKKTLCFNDLVGEDLNPPEFQGKVTVTLDGKQVTGTARGDA